MGWISVGVLFFLVLIFLAFTKLVIGHFVLEVLELKKECIKLRIESTEAATMYGMILSSLRQEVMDSRRTQFYHYISDPRSKNEDIEKATESLASAYEQSNERSQQIIDRLTDLQKKRVTNL